MRGGKLAVTIGLIGAAASGVLYLVSIPFLEGADDSDGPATMASARPYDAGHDEIELVLAGPEWMRRWGLDRPLEVGAKLEVVGYLGSSDKQALRPVMFWLANGQGVWQQLPSFPQRPEPAAN